MISVEILRNSHLYPLQKMVKEPFDCLVKCPRLVCSCSQKVLFLRLNVHVAPLLAKNSKMAVEDMENMVVVNDNLSLYIL